MQMETPHTWASLHRLLVKNIGNNNMRLLDCCFVLCSYCKNCISACTDTGYSLTYYRISAIRRHGYYLFHRVIRLRGDYSRAATNRGRRLLD